jgi:hypothetical protein
MIDHLILALLLAWSLLSSVSYHPRERAEPPPAGDEIPPPPPPAE